MQTTANFGLKKPDGTDTIKRSDFNYNFDIIDGKLKSLENISTLVGVNSNGIQTTQPNDFAGLAKKNNVNIDSWYGVSFSNKCPNQVVPVDGVGIAMDVRTGKLMTRGNIECGGDVIVNGQSLFQLASNGKNNIVNAITGAGGSANTGMSFDQLASAIGNLGGMKYASGVANVTLSQTSASGHTFYAYNATINVPFQIKGAYFDQYLFYFNPIYTRHEEIFNLSIDINNSGTVNLQSSFQTSASHFQDNLLTLSGGNQSSSPLNIRWFVIG